MTRSTAVRLLLAILALAALAACALGGQTSSMAFRSFTVEGGPVQFNLRGTGPVEWTGRVTVKGGGLTLTADDGLKLWPTADRRDAERVAAKGNVTVEGQYLAADRTRWDFTSKADAASYERTSGQGVMRGSVTFRAANAATGAVLSASADKLIYSFKTQQFRFERGDKPVRMEWQEPAPPAAQPAPESKEASGK